MKFRVVITTHALDIACVAHAVPAGVECTGPVALCSLRLKAASKQTHAANTAAAKAVRP